MAWRLAPIVLAACSFHPPSGEAPKDAPIDTKVDSPHLDAPSLCFGSGLDVVNTCLTALPTDPYDVTADTSLDTGAGGMKCDHDIATFCVVAATSIHVEAGATLGAHGPRPLVLLSLSDITIDGIVDVGSHITGMQHTGPAANASTCHNGTGPTGNGGGWGGSFGTKGGDGGPPTGGVAGATIVPATLQGGCSGSDAAGGGHRGNGGGAVYMIAATIVVNNTVNASGEAGTTSPAQNRGGGGAGSGGMIVFDTPSLMVAAGAQVFANGGGGGEGTGGNAGTNGSDPVDASAGGAGGGDTTSGGNGGNGAAGTADGSPGLASTNGTFEGGGGGGGGVGVIRVFRAAPPTGNVSPPAS